MLFKTEKDLENMGKRFLTWGNALRVFVFIFFMHTVYVVLNILITGKEFVLRDFLYRITMDFVAPGTLEIESLIKFLFVNDLVVNNVYIRMLLLISLPIFLNFALNSSLRKVVKEYIVKIYSKYIVENK